MIRYLSLCKGPLTILPFFDPDLSLFSRDRYVTRSICVIVKLIDVKKTENNEVDILSLLLYIKVQHTISDFNTSGYVLRQEP